MYATQANIYGDTNDKNVKKQKWEIIRNGGKENAEIKQPQKPKKETIPVQPLVGDEIQRAKDFLLARPVYYSGYGLRERDYALFCFNINIGLRISDLLNLKVCDIMADGEIRDNIILREQKTEKKREIFLNAQVKKILTEYMASFDEWHDDWYLFHSLFPRRNPYESMGRHNVNRLMKEIEVGIGLKVPLGTHSLRKTFARAVFDKLLADGDMLGIEKLKELLGHSSTAITRAYIGLQREETKNIYLKDLI